MQTGGARRKMKYLFFDTECANCFDRTGKLFSIGFVLTDENFNVSEPREDILINPDAPFDWFVVRKMMAYDRRIFKTKPKFDAVFPRLVELLDGAVAVGFNTAADVVYLLDECNRYKLDPPKIRFFDVQLWEQKLSERQNVCRLAAAYETWCGMEAHDAHRSDMDAEMTMNVAKAMCARLGINMDEAVAANPDFQGETEGFYYAYSTEEMRDSRDKTPRPHYRKVKPGQENFCLRGSRNYEMFMRFAEDINKRNDGKKVCLSDNLESFDYDRAMRALTRIDAAGMGYTFKPAEAAVYVSVAREDETGKMRKCSKFNRARRLAKEGAIEMMTADEFESAYPLPEGANLDWDRFDKPEFAREVKRKKRKRRKNNDPTKQGSHR